MDLPITELTIKDIDTGIVKYYDKILDIHVTDKQQQRIKVKVGYAGQERWKMSKDNEAVDQDGRKILPVIIIRRQSINRVLGMKALGVEQPYIFISKRLDEKTNILQTNWFRQQTATLPPSKQKKQMAVYETLTIPYPEVFTVNYKITIWSNYIKHADEIIETIWHNLDYALTFKFPVKNFGDEVNPETKEPSYVYMVGYLQPEVTHETNFDDFSREERMIKYSFLVDVHAATYMWPKSTGTSFGKDEKGKKIVERQYSAYKIVFNKEEDWLDE